MALQHRSDPGGIKKETTDRQRDLAAKGGPSTGIGDAQNRQVPTPATDPGTQAAARSTKQQQQSGEEIPGEGGLDDPTRESQTHSRGSNGARGSNH